MSLDDYVFNLRFMSKQLARQSVKAEKEEKASKLKCKKVHAASHGRHPSTIARLTRVTTGDGEGQYGRRQYIRPERHPAEERGVELPQAQQSNRCRCRPMQHGREDPNRM